MSYLCIGRQLLLTTRFAFWVQLWLSIYSWCTSFLAALYPIPLCLCLSLGRKVSGDRCKLCQTFNTFAAQSLCLALVSLDLSFWRAVSHELPADDELGKKLCFAEQRYKSLCRFLVSLDMSYGRIASAPGEPGKRRDLFLVRLWPSTAGTLSCRLYLIPLCLCLSLASLDLTRGPRRKRKTGVG